MFDRMRARAMNNGFKSISTTAEIEEEKKTVITAILRPVHSE